MKIGITERGDAGLDLSWANKLQSTDMAILITKNLNGPFKEKVTALQHNFNLIVHATCTGWGGTYMEPAVPDYKTQLDALKELTLSFPIEQCVLRVDPIIPTPMGLDRVRNVLQYAESLGLIPGMRVRVSIIDEYAHVKARFAKQGLPPVYQDNRKYPNANEIRLVKHLLAEFPQVTFETCAEMYLTGRNIERTGCVSAKDLAIFNLKPDTNQANPQNRLGCLCLCGKHELLENKHRCPHQCLYCYWKD